MSNFSRNEISSLFLLGCLSLCFWGEKVGRKWMNKYDYPTDYHKSSVKYAGHILFPLYRWGKSNESQNTRKEEMRTSSSRRWEAGHSCSGRAVLSSAVTARNPGADNTCDRQQIQWERSSCVLSLPFVGMFLSPSCYLPSGLPGSQTKWRAAEFKIFWWLFFSSSIN